MLEQAQIVGIVAALLHESDGCCVIVLTGKAPPNLSQGVPPLLPNQYIMGPGGLLPAYPVSSPQENHRIIVVYFEISEHKT